MSNDTINEALHTETSRRSFLAGAGATLLGMTAAGATGLSPARAAEDGPLVRTGSGTHTYECVHDWLMPPANLLWGDTQGVAQDSQGRIYISHTVHPKSESPDAIVVFDQNGKFLNSWGSRFRGGGHGLDIRKEGDTEYLYHCDTAHHLVVKTTLDGTVVWEKGIPTESNVYDAKHIFTPTNVALAPDGGFYVGDGYGSSFVHQYDSKANYVRTFGGKGSDPGKLDCPHGLWIDTRAGVGSAGEPLLVVADRSNHRLQYFTLDGKHVRFDTIGMRSPCHFDIRGDMMLIPDLESVVTLIDTKDQVVASLGDGTVDGKRSNLRGAPRSAFIPGKFITPHSAKFLHNGDILVVEWVPIGRVTLLRQV